MKRKGFNVPVKILAFALLIMIIVVVLMGFSTNTTNKVKESVLNMIDVGSQTSKCNAVRSKCQSACSSACIGGGSPSAGDLKVKYNGNVITCGKSACTKNFKCSCQ
ncbi:MAG: hypothetical protein SVU32_09675 [Candidatus Nanohaloarchaea archaeon]|nr:hypothetical protein [Candidatus Nanohaloarchaea archaeon]